ncbi:hypothetical protein N0V83_000682 [Neocucurbitaria cava]|uniref:CMP/dCMP-type deaminase domain-containing protein n=1 Tax=Neocucurbitaria cava TaxID=798079 RepID=A0A9W8YKB4_9PLEO|nr:hypothetical protein N0V83_000682 [Neocucurbitaria cava]
MKPYLLHYVNKMKTDNYLNLCLDQATKSPLRYRHGAIVVRGGKVIGQGFNDYRSGFNGGALKTGRLRLGSFPAIATLKKKSKVKRDLEELQEEATGAFTPFETLNGGGKLANTSLSMHSEMMAIHSALTASSTMASSAMSYQKPCFKLLGDSKRKARLRRDAINSYVEAVCKAALNQSTAKQSYGQSQVQEWRFEGSTPRPRYTEPRVSGQTEPRGRGTSGGQQCGETPTEEREEESSSSQSWQQLQPWTTTARASTVCT